jgi:ATP-dependent Lon protease
MPPKRKPNNDNKNNKKSKKKDKIDLMLEQVEASSMPDNIKEIAKSKIESANFLEKGKTVEWCETLLKIPFNKYKKLPITNKSNPEKINEYFSKAQQILDNSVHGMESVKEEIIQYIAQFISTNNKSMSRVIGLVGCPGCGKTSLIKRGLSPALNRPMKLISMGGVRDSSHFVGFDYTYVGSRHGVILQTLIETKCMNPIIFMDELDKVSTGHEGMDVINLLVHLTDPVQNNTFTDKYFSDFEIDLSKVVFVFSFNDEKSINPILKDRLHIIRIPDPDLQSKIVIGKKYLPKEIFPNIGFKLEDIIIPDEIIKFIVKQYCSNDKGVRGIKRVLETILLKINVARYIQSPKYPSLKNIKFPLELTEKIVTECINKSSNSFEDYVLSHMFI